MRSRNGIRRGGLDLDHPLHVDHEHDGAADQHLDGRRDVRVDRLDHRRQRADELLPDVAAPLDDRQHRFYLALLGADQDRGIAFTENPARARQFRRLELRPDQRFHQPPGVLTLHDREDQLHRAPPAPGRASRPRRICATACRIAHSTAGTGPRASITLIRWGSFWASQRNPSRTRSWKARSSCSMRSPLPATPAATPPSVSARARRSPALGSMSRSRVRSGITAPVATAFTARTTSTPSLRPIPWYASDVSTNRSQTTHLPARRAGAMTSATSWARAAANRSISARASISVHRGSSRSDRIRSPIAVPPGSRTPTTSQPLFRR